MRRQSRWFWAASRTVPLSNEKMSKETNTFGPEFKFGRDANASIAAGILRDRTGQDWFIDLGPPKVTKDQRRIMTDFIKITPGAVVVDGIDGIKLQLLGRGSVPVISELQYITQITEKYRYHLPFLVILSGKWISTRFSY